MEMLSMKRQINVTLCYLQEVSLIIIIPITKLYTSNSTDWLKKSMCELDWNKEEGEAKTSTSCKYTDIMQIEKNTACNFRNKTPAKRNSHRLT
jgi:hypothetical protein